jgi:hypothetical protein
MVRLPPSDFELIDIEVDLVWAHVVCTRVMVLPGRKYHSAKRALGEARFEIAIGALETQVA